MERVVYRFCLMLLLLGPSFSHAQIEIAPLERVMEVSLTNVSSQEALKVLEQQGNLVFAYQTNLVPDNDKINRSYISKTTREILDDLFQGRLTYKEKGNYIILKEAPRLKDQEVRIEGYIFNKTTQEKVGFASIYDSISLTSCVSDAYGHYSLQLKKEQPLALVVRKMGFVDTTFVWDGSGNTVLHIPLRPIEKEVSEDTIVPKRFNFFELSDEQKANLLNIKDKMAGKVQFSIVPGIGTNGDLSPVTTVDYSVNLFGGFNKSVRKAEIGGIFNIDWDTVQYIQVAGFLNAVGGYQRGVQVAGFTNLNNDSFEGIQSAGFYSLVRKDFFGVQSSGFGNTILGDLEGLQAAGYFNYAGSGSKAVQAAGFANFCKSNLTGAQLAGFGNYTGNKSKGTQIGGFMNVAGNEYEGTQIAGFINVAREIKGSQIGFLNFSDTIEGVPVGFLSFSRKGLHQLELSSNEVMHANVGFKTGTNQFYNTFMVGSQLEKNPYWSLAYGIGSSVRTTKKSRVFFDVQGSSVLHENAISNASFLGRFTTTYQYSFAKKFSIAIGPAFNLLVVQSPTSIAGMDARSLAPYSFYDQTHNGNSIQMWVGGQLALRFF